MDRLDDVLEALPSIFSSLVLLLAFLLVGRGLAAAAGRVLVRARNADRYRELTERIIRWAFTGVGLVLALQLLGLTAVATSLLATGGLVAVVLGFAFKEIGENLLAGLFLGLSRSFEVGDLIESSGHTGTVRDIDLRNVHIRTADGRDIYIPSAQIFRNVLVNFTQDRLRRPEFSIGIDYGDSSARARELLLEEVRATEGVIGEPPPEVQLGAFEAQYQELKVLFWVQTGGKPSLGSIRTAAMERCLTRLREEGFTLSSEVRTAVDVSPLEVRRPGSESEG